MLVTGIVSEYNSGTLPGANVIELGTNNGTITDVEGKFSLNVSSPSSELKFSYIGYHNDTYVVDQINGKKVELYPANEELNEVVVTNNYKKPDYTIWYVLAAIAVTAIGYKVLKKEKPQRVKV